MLGVVRRTRSGEGVRRTGREFIRGEPRRLDPGNAIYFCKLGGPKCLGMAKANYCGISFLMYLASFEANYFRFFGLFSFSSMRVA